MWSCGVAASLQHSVIVNGKAFLLQIPGTLCEGSKTGWGIDYKRYLVDLGIASSGKPRILSVIADCEFVVSAEDNALPSTWGYIAFDKTVGRYWFGQKSLNKRMRREIEGLEFERPEGIDLKEITNNSLNRLKSNLSVGQIVRLGNPIESNEGFLVSALARLESDVGDVDVYLTTVTFIRNRQILTFAIYEKASSEVNLDHVRSIGKQFLELLHAA